MGENMQKTPMIKIISLWEAYNDTGVLFYKGKFGSTDVVMWPNHRKESDKSPDNILWARDKEGKNQVMIFGVWRKQTKNGSDMWTGSLDLMTRVMGFRQTNKRNPKAPDIEFFVSKKENANNSNDAGSEEVPF